MEQLNFDFDDRELHDKRERDRIFIILDFIDLIKREGGDKVLDDLYGYDSRAYEKIRTAIKC